MLADVDHRPSRSTRSSPSNRRVRRALLVGLAALGAFLGSVGLGTLLGACAQTSNPGPAFAAAPGPAEGRSRLYIYRLDPQHSMSSVQIALDGRSVGDLHHGEYATFDLAAGPHRVDFRQRGLAFVSWGWNRQTIRPKSGETIYLEVSVRMSERPMPETGHDLEIGGRGGGAASENVFLQHRGAAEALDRLAGTTLRVE
jgi:hypothetical protein